MLLKHKKDWRLSENSSVPCTEEAILREEVNTEVEKVTITQNTTMQWPTGCTCVQVDSATLRYEMHVINRRKTYFTRQKPVTCGEEAKPLFE